MKDCATPLVCSVRRSTLDFILLIGILNAVVRRVLRRCTYPDDDIGPSRPVPAQTSSDQGSCEITVRLIPTAQIV
jgi:hypothetical protein